jgi:hypothetical protein
MTYFIIAVLVIACIIMHNDKEQWREGHQKKQDLINKGKDCYYQAVVDARKIKDETKRAKEQILFLANREANLIKEENKKKIADIEEERNLLTAAKTAAIKDFPVLATIIADYENAKDLAIENNLRYKDRPAVKAADEVKKIRGEKRILIVENHAYKWELLHLKKLLPWLEDIEEEAITPVHDYINANFAENDSAGFWLTPDEYMRLRSTEKYQLALKRYCTRHKSNQEIGTEYERFIGYMYETKGYKVEFVGIEKGLEDLGRDLICTNDKEVLIVQCKCWSNKKNKVIREKYINQLCGTALMYKIKHPECKKAIKPVFVSTVPYSDTAKEFAKYLNIQCIVQPLEKYPMIKCNINLSTNEKIYHLPFDQQYDKCVINKKLGECYVMTVQEAENKGFRRARRWLGHN